tara:strand:- start:483 stop:707 length:225 start_codon:yes stop_codon:yes gene_type:complete
MIRHIDLHYEFSAAAFPLQPSESSCSVKKDGHAGISLQFCGSLGPAWMGIPAAGKVWDHGTISLGGCRVVATLR